MLLWEIFNRKLPYGELDNLSVAMKVSKNELHLSLPNQEVYPIYHGIMKKSLTHEPKFRPTFHEICLELKQDLKEFEIVPIFKSISHVSEYSMDKTGKPYKGLVSSPSMDSIDASSSAYVKSKV